MVLEFWVSVRKFWVPDLETAHISTIWYVLYPSIWLLLDGLKWRYYSAKFITSVSSLCHSCCSSVESMMAIKSSYWWVPRWLVRWICARKVLIHLGQGMVAGDEHLSAFDFLACRLFSAVMVLSFLWVFAPLCRAARHLFRFCAASSQVTGFRLKDLIDPFKVSL